MDVEHSVVLPSCHLTMTVTPSTTEAGKKRPAEEIAQEAEEEEEDLRRYGDASYWEGRYKAKKQRLDEEGDKTGSRSASSLVWRR